MAQLTNTNVSDMGRACLYFYFLVQMKSMFELASHI
jgi:hypothetical protein